MPSQFQYYVCSKLGKVSIGQRNSSKYNKQHNATFFIWVSEVQWVQSNDGNVLYTIYFIKYDTRIKL